MDIFSENHTHLVKLLDPNKSESRTLDYVCAEIEEKKQDYKEAISLNNVVLAGQQAYNISQLHYKKAKTLGQTTPDNEYGKMCCYQSQAHWLRTSLNLGDDRAYTSFADAIFHKDKPSSRFRLEKLEGFEIDNEKITFDENGYKKLISVSLDHGEKSACWSMYMSLRHKEDPKSSTRLKMLEERNISYNDDGKILLLSVAALGKHARAAIALDKHFTNHQEDLDFLPQELKSPDHIEQTKNWFKHISLRDFRIKAEFIENHNNMMIREKMAEIKENTFSYKKADDLKKEIVKGYALNSL